MLWYAAIALSISRHAAVAQIISNEITVSEDAWIEPRTVAILTLTARRSGHLARSHPLLARFHPHLARSHPHLDIFLHYLVYVETSSNYLVFCIFAGLKRVYLLFF